MEKLIKKYIKFIKENNIPLESIVLSNKDGVLVKEDFKKLRYRNIYSHTKSFTSLLVGIALDERKISLDDKLISFFKNELTKSQKEKLKDIKIKHLLTMSSGFGKAYLMMGDRENGVAYDDYLKFLFKQKLLFKPGSKFVYSNGDTYLVSRIIEKVYKKPYQLILYDKLLKPLDIGFTVIETDYQGRAIGATGMFLNCENMNKLGRLLINNGKWNNKQIISKKYISLIKKEQIKTEHKDDWGRSYSYQFWLCPWKDSFRADGAYGQITMVFLNEGYTLSIQCSEIDGQGEFILKTLREKVLDPFFKNRG